VGGVGSLGPVARFPLAYGLIIGGAGAAAVGGLAAPALVTGAVPTLIDAAGEPIIQATETMLQHFGENYPELTKLATKLGFHGAAAGSTVGAWELLKHITGQSKTPVWLKRFE